MEYTSRVVSSLDEKRRFRARLARWGVVSLVVGSAASPIHAAQGGIARSAAGGAVSASPVALIQLDAGVPLVSEAAGPTTVVVTATLLPNGVLPADVDVVVAVSGSGDAEAVDFTPVANFVITVPAGAVSATGSFLLQPEDDQLNEATEVLTLAGTATLPVGSAQLELQDDDPSPVMTLTGGRTTEPGTMNFVITFDRPSGRTVKGYYYTDRVATPGKIHRQGFTRPATADVDFRPVLGTLAIPPGETRKVIAVEVFDDAVDEPTEAVLFTYHALENAKMDPGRPAGRSRCSGEAFTREVTCLCGYIYDDEPTVSLAIDDARAAESDPAIDFNLRLSAHTEKIVQLRFNTGDLTAQAGKDYRPTANQTVAYDPADGLEFPFGVALIDDSLDEGDETFALSVSSALGRVVVMDGTATGTIVEDDILPRLSVAGGSGTEGGALDFVISASAASVSTMQVNYQTSDGTAVSGQDYQAAQGTLTFAPGELSRTVSVSTLDDALDESTEKFTLTLSSPTNAKLAVARADSTILDNDVPPQLSVADASGDEGSALGFVVSLSSLSGQTAGLFKSPGFSDGGRIGRDVDRLRLAGRGGG